MILYFVMIGLQLAVAVHALKTGRPVYWIFIVAFLPLIGILAYLIVEILPGLSQGRTARRVQSDVKRLVDPGRAYRHLAREVEAAPTVENRKRLAEECLRLGRTSEAAALYEGALTGIHATDPALMFGLARAVFDTAPARTQRILDELREENPDWENAEAHLLYARSLETQDRTAEALLEYEAVAAYYPGQEARYRYGVLLARLGRLDDARSALEGVVRSVELGGRLSRTMQSEWYRQAKQRLAELGPA